jgi:hypothetical protein
MSLAAALLAAGGTALIRLLHLPAEVVLRCAFFKYVELTARPNGMHGFLCRLHFHLAPLISGYVRSDARTVPPFSASFDITFLCSHAFKDPEHTGSPS